MTDYEGLRPWATQADREKLDALKEAGSNRKAAKLLGIHQRTFESGMARLRARAAKFGYAPEHDMTHTAAPGFAVKGTSTFYNDEGQPVAQWVKTSVDREQQDAMMREAVEALKEEIKPAKPTKSPKHCNSKLACQYTITDYHLGMLAWGEETGDDWDTEIAENLLVAWFARAIESAPDSEVGIFAQLGDFMHWDGIEAVTPTSKHSLDADTRYRKLIRVAMKVTRQVIEMMLKKHKRVHVVICEGNHDLTGSMWLSEFVHQFYSKEKRVTVDTSADVFYAYEFGDVGIFYHHGHKRPPKNIDSVFVAKFRELYGRTKYHFAHMGHLHHDVINETNLMRVEQHRTLAAPDAYASRGGYVSCRDAKVTVYHKNYGRVAEYAISPEMLK